MPKLQRSFYLREDVVQISKELLGKYLFTNINNKLTGGIIIETEAYDGVKDSACHAYKGRRTQRTEIMYHRGGVGYVYLCYGIHSLFNVITNSKDTPEAILIRSILPVEGIDTMLKRRNKSTEKALTGGPGTVSQALGISCDHNGTDLIGNSIWIEDKGLVIQEKDITSGIRVGVESAGRDGLLPYRFKINIGSKVLEKGRS